ncbi:glycoside hydrolase family 6 protein [Catellatospora sichuanensis]|uniref:glycoside hydrolase family 6 protein n=1 Tax=Catellatospora sichuanensis TaxID=1969805 RepID=UPI0011844B4E|nr:glycoside hydrolase family 6 protein [Catellatospora sichuanensis]
MKFPIRLSGRRKLVALTGASTLVVAGLITIPATMAHAAPGCDITYTTNDWTEGAGTGGFTGTVVVKNTGDAITSWTLKFAFPGGQTFTQGWSANWTASGANVTATNLPWNGALGTGASTSLGFNGRWTGSNPKPTAFTLNNVACTVGGVTPTASPSTPASPSASPSTPASPSASPSAPASPSASPSAPASPSSSPTVPGVKVDNPYSGARGYVNPEWKAKAESVSGGSRVSNTSTAVWLDRIAAIAGTSGSSSNGSMGLADHLDAALAQYNAGSGPLTVQFVIYNLPGRDCAALASNGELGVDELPRYKSEYIDPIAAIMGQSKYAALRIVAIIEIDSLPNLVTNLNIAKCQTMNNNGGYVKGIGYALNKLGAISNVYNYIDAAHHGWIGWDTNFGPSALKFKEAATAEGSTVDKVHGFIANTANYSTLVEPYFTIGTSVNGTSIRQSKWVDWNQYVDEQSFAQAFRTRLVSEGFPSNIGMLIDTSRNGWGGSARPTAASTSTVVDTFVNQSRIDRRIHAGNWCNQSGAGMGERPRANPATGIDAYVWVKPPGESDGSSSLIPNNEGKGFDRMCDPTYTGNGLNGNNLTGALANAPISGAWFSAQFAELMANAYPPLS